MSFVNALTFIRIFISPIFLLLYIAGGSFGITPILLPYALLILLLISELSDALDGYLARKWGEVTDLGKVFDPMADSIVRISVLLAFTQPPIELPLFIVFLFLYRDSVIGALRTICALKGHALHARASGKLKAILLGVSSVLIVVLMIPHSLGSLTTRTLQNISFYLFGTIAIYTLCSGIDYLRANKTFLAQLFRPKQVKDV